MVSKKISGDYEEPVSSGNLFLFEKPFNCHRGSTATSDVTTYIM
jgi:hypothetical protein